MSNQFDPIIGTEDDESIDLSNMFEQQASSAPHLEKFRTLELNADYIPLSFKPLSTQPWNQIMFWLVKGRIAEAAGKPPIITVVEEYEDLVVRSANETFKLPAVIAHTTMIPLKSMASPSRSNILMRDNYTCQYTGIQYPPQELTLDHIMPRSRGGKTNWMNLVACHDKVNFRKADRTPQEAGLRLIREPYIPDAWEMREKGRNHPTPFMHDSWRDYVYWNIPLDED